MLPIFTYNLPLNEPFNACNVIQKTQFKITPKSKQLKNLQTWFQKYFTKILNAVRNEKYFWVKN